MFDSYFLYNFHGMFNSRKQKSSAGQESASLQKLRLLIMPHAMRSGLLLLVVLQLVTQTTGMYGMCSMHGMYGTHKTGILHIYPTTVSKPNYFVDRGKPSPRR